MQKQDNITPIFDDLDVTSLTLSTFIVGNLKFNNYYENTEYHDKPNSFFNIFDFNQDNNTNYINLIIPSSSNTRDNYFLRIENVNNNEKEERIKAINTFNEIYEFVKTLKLPLSLSVPKINDVKYAHSDDQRVIRINLTKLFYDKQIETYPNNPHPNVKYSLRNIEFTNNYADNLNDDIKLKQKIVKTFGQSFCSPQLKQPLCSTSLFITKTEFISNAVTFHDKIEEIKKESDTEIQYQKMQKFLMAQTNLLYFYILLNNEKQIVSFDSHYNNIMILSDDYKVALIDFKQYYKTSEIVNDIDINTPNSSFQNSNTAFVQYLKNNNIYDILFEDEEQPDKRRKSDNETDQIKINREINPEIKPEIKNGIICLLFAEYYAHHKICKSTFCTSLLDSHLINLLKDPFNTNDNISNDILKLLNDLYDKNINSYVKCNSEILNYIMGYEKTIIGGKNIGYHKIKHTKKQIKKRTKKRTKKQIKKQTKKQTKKHKNHIKS